MMVEGEFRGDGSWRGVVGSPFRDLTAQEVVETKAMAENVTPVFGGENNAEWEQHHPVAREIFERRGLKPAV